MELFEQISSYCYTENMNDMKTKKEFEDKSYRVLRIELIVSKRL